MIKDLPYLSQFESATLVTEILQGRLDAKDDPNWQDAGWATRDLYAFWAWQTCGVACLRMLLPPKLRPTTATITQELITAGAYEVRGNQVRGLIYEPFTNYVTTTWRMRASVQKNLTPAALQDYLQRPGTAALISVNPEIRDVDAQQLPQPCAEPGGHLVLATGASSVGITFHNPSGHPHSQSAVTLPWHHFNPLFAQRGITITIPEDHHD